MNLKELIKKMNACDQLEGRITMLEHGQMVKERLCDLIKSIKGEPTLFNWQLPSWIKNNEDLFLKHIPTASELYLYTVLHDCGKPFTRVKDECG